MLELINEIDLVLASLCVLFVVALLVLRAGIGTVHLDSPAGEPIKPREIKTEPLAQLSIQGGSEGLWEWDLETDTFRVSQGWAEILGYESIDVGDKSSDWFSFVHPYYLSGLRMDLAAHLQGERDRFDCEYRIRHRGGTYRWVLCRGRAVRDEQGKALRISGVQTDVTRLIEVENRLIEDALQDRLTGLPNKNFFTAQLSQAIDAAGKNPRFRFGVLFLDLDRFKDINDTLGHPVGDQLLAATAKRLKACVRPEDHVARFGGDEFVPAFSI